MPATPLDTLLVRIDADISGLRTQLARVERQNAEISRRLQGTFSRLNRSLDGSALSVGRLRSALAALGVGLTALQTVNAAISFERITNALEAATGSAEAGAAAYGFVRDEAIRLGIDLEPAAQGFAQLSAAAQGTVLQGEGVRDIFSAVAETGRVLGLSNEQIRGTITALNQIVGKGVLSMEELRQQLGDRIPGAVQIAARAMDVTVARLFEMAEAGEISATQFLPRFAAELRKTFGGALPQAVNGAQASFARLRTAIFDLRVQVARSGFLDGVVTAVTELSDTISEPRFQTSMKQFGETLGNLLTSAAQNADKLAAVVSAIGGIRLAALAGAPRQIQLLAGGLAAIGGSTAFVRAFETGDEAMARVEARAAELRVELVELQNKALDQLEFNDQSTITLGEFINQFETLGDLQQVIPEQNQAAFQSLVGRIKEAQAELLDLQAQISDFDDPAIDQTPLAAVPGGAATGDEPEVSKAARKATEKIRDLIRALEDENAVLAVNEQERQKTALLLKAEELAREGNIRLSDEFRQRIEALADEQRRLTLEAERLAEFEARVGEAFAEASRVVEDTLTPQERYNRRISELNNLLPELTIKLGSATRAQEVLRRASDEAGRELNESLRDAELGIEQVRDSGSELASGFVSGLRSATDATDGLGDALQRLADRVNEAILNIAVFGPLETGLKTAFGPDPFGIAGLFSPSTGGAIPQGEVTPLPRRRPDQAVAGLGAAAVQATTAIDATSAATDVLTASGDAASDVLGDQLATEAINSAVAAASETAASQTLTTVLIQLAAAAETAAAALASVAASGGASGAGGFLSSIFGSSSGFSPSTSVGVPATSGFNTAGFSAGPLTFADGGIPPVGVPSIVGEQGPELFVPKVPGRIIPNSQMGMGGGVLVQQSFTFNGRVTAAERAELLAVARAGGQEAVAAFKTGISRGGRDAQLVGRR